MKRTNLTLNELKEIIGGVTEDIVDDTDGNRNKNTHSGCVCYFHDVYSPEATNINKVTGCHCGCV